MKAESAEGGRGEILHTGRGAELGGPAAHTWVSSCRVSGLPAPRRLPRCSAGLRVKASPRGILPVTAAVSTVSPVFLDTHPPAGRRGAGPWVVHGGGPLDRAPRRAGVAAPARPAAGAVSPGCVAWLGLHASPDHTLLFFSSEQQAAEAVLRLPCHEQALHRPGLGCCARVRLLNWVHIPAPGSARAGGGQD